MAITCYPLYSSLDCGLLCCSCFRRLLVHKTTALQDNRRQEEKRCVGRQLTFGIVPPWQHYDMSCFGTAIGRTVGNERDPRRDDLSTHNTTATDKCAQPRYRHRLPFSPVVELPSGEGEGETPMEKEREERAKRVNVWACACSRWRWSVCF